MSVTSRGVASAAPKQEFIYDYSGDAIHVPLLYVPDHVGTPTGILDSEGEEIIRPPRKMGFV